jgi:DnaJ family protein C protein 19
VIKGLLIAALVAYCGWWLWQGPKHGPKPMPPPRPSEESAALAVLGLGASADEAEIRAAHRRLLQAVHPDHGGSAELTRRVNAARDVLLKRRIASD